MKPLNVQIERLMFHFLRTSTACSCSSEVFGGSNYTFQVDKPRRLGKQNQTKECFFVMVTFCYDVSKLFLCELHVEAARKDSYQHKLYRTFLWLQTFMLFEHCSRAAENSTVLGEQQKTTDNCWTRAVTTAFCNEMEKNPTATFLITRAGHSRKK